MCSWRAKLGTTPPHGRWIASNKVNNLNLTEAAKVANVENERIAKLIGINKAARVTCVKPSGSTSTVLGCSSGIHAWHNDYYIRRIRVNKNEAIYTYLSIYHPELLEDEYFRPHDTAVISIPQRSPVGSTLRTETEIELLERVKRFHSEWIKPGHRNGDNTHNVSATISVRDENWDSVGDWVWENRDSFTGLSFLPYFGHTYKQAPFEDIDVDEFERLFSTLTDIDLSKVIELDDETNLTGEAACSGGNCEIN
jgi:ribonucleoside-diphosphate reductase alpha chain